MRVTFVTRDPGTVASARVRIAQYLPVLRELGIEARALVWEPRNRLAAARAAVELVRLARRSDVVVLQKPRLPTRVLDAVARANPRIVVDVDDAVWASRKPDREREYRTRFDAAVARARGVVVGSRYLGAELARRLPDAPPAVVLPSSVRLSGFPVSGEPALAGHQAEVPVIGWIGSPTNLVDFGDEVVGVLEQLVAEHRARFVVMSSTPLRRNGFESELVPWSLAREPDVLAGFDLGVMPLPDDERTRGRCSYKAVQYLAAGAAAVASPVGSAPEVVRDGSTGVLARTPDEWDRALRRLLGDPGARSRLVAGGRTLVEESYCVEVNAPRWVDVLEDVAGT